MNIGGSLYLAGVGHLMVSLGTVQLAFPIEREVFLKEEQS